MTDKQALMDAVQRVVDGLGFIFDLWEASQLEDDPKRISKLLFNVNRHKSKICVDVEMPTSGDGVSIKFFESRGKKDIELFEIHGQPSRSN